MKISETITAEMLADDCNKFFANILDGLETYPENNIEIDTDSDSEISVPDGWGGMWYIPVRQGEVCWAEGGHSSDPDPDWDGE